jgi:hypothetical protein
LAFIDARSIRFRADAYLALIVGRENNLVGVSSRDSNIALCP